MPHRFSAVEALIISIHAPHARSDLVPSFVSTCTSLFQSTLLMRGATRNNCGNVTPPGISIHAPHARSDGRPAGG